MTHRKKGWANAGSPLTVAVKQRDANLLQMVRTALRTRNVRLAYQPIVRARDVSQPAFFEGLIRVLDETGRVIPAREFMHTIETREEGRIIDCLALEYGLKALSENPSLRLSVNMSARSIGYSGWEAALDRGLYDQETVAERLILEITESSAMLIPDMVVDFMERMHDKGISFALDDFGAGYTAFRFFKDFFFDMVKIDGEFIRNIHTDSDNQVLAEALVMIAQQFDMFTVAEFVETPQEADYLIQNGIDCLQGYLYGAPTLSPVWSQQTMAQRSA